MKLSRYVYIAQQSPTNYIAACTTTQAVISLGVQEFEDLQKGDINQCVALSKEQYNDCVDMGFLVPENLDEKKYLQYIMNKDRYSPEALTTYIAFTTACNFRCKYCYEKGQVKTETLSEHNLPTLLE